MIALIRHGQYAQQANTPSALQPYGLTADGRVEAVNKADAFAEFCQSQTLNPVMYCSSSLRAFQTAQVFSNRLGLRLEQAEALCERSVGALANLTVEQITQVVSEDPRHPELPEGWKSDSHFKLPYEQCESLLEAGARVAAFIQSKQVAGQLTLFVGHGASFRHAAVHLGILTLPQAVSVSMHFAQPVVFDDFKSPSVYGDWKPRPRKDGLD